MGLARAELHLPQMHYIETDDWAPKLGADAYIAWKTLHTWVTRTNRYRKDERVRCSVNGVIKRLGKSKGYFFQKILRPLFNYGLIEYVDSNMPGNYGNKPKNIIVNTYPYGNPANATRPLEALRDFDTDYKSAARENGKLGGRPSHRKYAKHKTNTNSGGSGGDLIIDLEESYLSTEEIQAGVNDLFGLPNEEKTNKNTEDKLHALKKQQHNPGTNVPKSVVVDLKMHKLAKKCQTTIKIRFGDRPEMDVDRISMSSCYNFIKDAIQGNKDPFDIIDRVDTDYRNKDIGNIIGILRSAVHWEDPVSAASAQDNAEEIQNILHALEGLTEWAQDEKKYYGYVRESTLTRIFNLQMELNKQGIPLQSST